MVSFENTIQIAKQVFQSWSDYSTLREVTVIRDVFGHLAFLLSTNTPAEPNIAGIKSALQSSLGPYFSGRIMWCEGKHNNLETYTIQEIDRLRQFDAAINGCNWYHVERVIAKKAWLDRNESVDPIWSYTDACTGTKPKVVTFYSFKGGMGRTTALAATALILAQQGKCVLAIDTDVEAPGLSTIFFDDHVIQKGTVDFLVENQADQAYTPNMQEYLLSVNDPALTANMDGQIYIIPAGKMENLYLSKLARIDYQDTVPDGMRNSLIKLIQSATDFIASSGTLVDYILLDARAGFHDMGGVITAQIPHGIVLLGRNNAQSWNGLKEVISLAATSQTDILPIALVDSICSSSSGNTQQKELFKSQAYSLCCDLYYSESEPSVEAEGEAHTPIYISYQPHLNDGVCLYSDGSTLQNESLDTAKNILCGTDYQAIVERIYTWFGDSPKEGDEQHDS